MVDGQIRQRAADRSFEIVISNERFGDDGALTVTSSIRFHWQIILLWKYLCPARVSAEFMLLCMSWEPD